MGFITTDEQRANAAARLIRAATGEQWGDGDMVTGLGIGYAPGNGGYKTDVWVTGNWNDKTTYNHETRTHTTVSTIPSRLGKALERIDVELEWSDENEECSGCQHLIRTEPDSYGWTPQYVWNDDGILCRDCILLDPAEYVATMANDVDKAITFLSADELMALGWHEATPSGSGANGWYPGQDDTPVKTLKRWKRESDSELPDGSTRDWVFMISDVGQFDIHWRLYARDDCDHEAYGWTNECLHCSAELEPVE